MKKLGENGVIKQYRAKINTAALGYDHYKVLLSVSGLNKQRIISLKEFFQQEEHVIYSTEAIGLGDIEFEAKTKSAEQTYALIAALREKFPCWIISWDSVIIRKEQMINYYPFTK